MVRHAPAGRRAAGFSAQRCPRTRITLCSALLFQPPNSDWSGGPTTEAPADGREVRPWPFHSMLRLSPSCAHAACFCPTKGSMGPVSRELSNCPCSVVLGGGSHGGGSDNISSNRASSRAGTAASGLRGPTPSLLDSSVDLPLNTCAAGGGAPRTRCTISSPQVQKRRGCRGLCPSRTNSEIATT